MTKQSFPGLRVLLVEDDAFIRFTMKRMFRALGAAPVMEASDGAAALALLAEGTVPDLILCDVNMAPMDGMTFVRQLRVLADAAIARVPVVMLSGESDDAVMERAAGLGVARCLAKPVSLDDLSAAVAGAGHAVVAT